MVRKANILVTGTPGTGKSSLSVALAKSLDLSHINISELVKDRALYERYDKQSDSYIIEDDKLLDYLEKSEQIKDEGGYIIDSHTCDLFPESWIDLVVVLRTQHTVLWDRLEARHYALDKIQLNNECEIMQVVLDEARDAYAPEIVMELQSDTQADAIQNRIMIEKRVKAMD